MRDIARNLAVCFVIAAAPLFAGDLIVTRYDDPVPDGCTAEHCSLREAVIEANADPDHDRIVLSAGTYALAIAPAGEPTASAGDLNVSSELEIVGPGASMTVIDAAGIDGLLLASGATADLTLRGVTLRGAAGSDTAVTAVSDAQVRVEECELRDNPSSGPAINASIGAFVTVVRSLVTANGGSGIATNGASAAITSSSFVANGFREIQISGSGSVVVCTHCSIRHDGVAISINGNNGGGIALLGNTIVDGSCNYLNDGALDSNGGNIEETTDTCSFDEASDQPLFDETDLALGALEDNGGPTRTMALGGTSSALDDGLDTECGATEAELDQRGGSRPATSCDPGAMEHDAASPATPIFHDGFEQGSPGAWLAVPS